MQGWYAATSDALARVTPQEVAGILTRMTGAELRGYFEERAAGLSDCAVLHVTDVDGSATCRLVPHKPGSVGVVLYVGHGGVGTVRLDDAASAPAELGESASQDRKAVEHVLDIAVDGRATAYHLGRGGCVEERDGSRVSRTWHNAWPWPGWRRRATRIDYLPYR